METRRAALEDLPQLAQLFDEYRVFYHKGSDVYGAVEFLKQRIANEESVIYVAEEENNLMGFTQLYPIFSSTNLKHAWLLNDLYVNPNSRGKGVSIALIDEAKELVRDTNSHGMMLETDKTNDIGNKLYPRTGFELDKDHNFYSWEV